MGLGGHDGDCPEVGDTVMNQPSSCINRTRDDGSQAIKVPFRSVGLWARPQFLTYDGRYLSSATRQSSS